MSKMRRHLIDTQFGQIHCRTMGSGPAVVMVHINNQSSAGFLELMANLAPNATAVAMDYPSHGMSDHISYTPSIADYATCVTEVMQGLGIPRYSVLGEATGAVVAVEMGVNNLDRVNGIIMLNCPIYKDTKQAHEVHSQVKSQTLRPVDSSGFPLTRTLEYVLANDPSHAPLKPDQSWLDRVSLGQIQAGRSSWQALDAVNAYDLANNFSKVGCEAMLLMGEHFHYTGQIEEYKKRFKRLTAEVIPNARFCMGWEKADVIAPKVVEFLKRVNSLN